MNKSPQGQRPTITSLRGMVAAAHPLATRVGISILDKGGNAFDAAVATAAALNVVEPFMSGIAGMGYATLWVAGQARVRVLDFVPPVPHSFTPDRFHSREQLSRGPASVSLPGNLAGWAELARTHGTMPLDHLFEPAAVLAETGFALADFGAYEFNHQLPAIASYPELFPIWRANYACPSPARVGHILRQPHLANTLRLLGRHGSAYFYDGPLGDRLVRHLAGIGGSLTAGDLRDVSALWREPARAAYRDVVVHTPPPPSEGFQILLTLRLLESIALSELPHNGPDHLDRVIRAIRLAALERIRHNNPSADGLADLLSDAHVAALGDRLRDPAPISGPTEQWTSEAPVGADPAHTTSFSVADQEGNLICITQSLGSAFGSLVVVPETGICLNNFLYWADVQPSSPNRAAPGSALTMCMAPSITTRNGKPVLALGTPGSYGILQTQVQAMVQYLDYGLSLQQAIEAPRARVWDGNGVEIENRISAQTIEALRMRGHDISAFPDAWTILVGGMQAIAIDPDTGLLTGAADPRRDGYAIGL